MYYIVRDTYMYLYIYYIIYVFYIITHTQLTILKRHIFSIKVRIFRMNTANMKKNCAGDIS